MVEVLAIPLMVVVGAMVAVQSELNGRLATGLGGGVRGGAAAAAISFGTGLVVLLALVALAPGPRAGVRRIASAARSGDLRPWHLLGGVGGAALVASQGLSVGAIGVALFTVSMVAGQTTGGLLVDRIGLGPSGPQAITAGRAAGALLTVGAVAVGVAGRLGGGDAVTVTVLALALLPLVAGGGVPLQQAANGQVSERGGPVAAAANNFLVGFLSLLVFLGAALLLAPGDLRGPPRSWWLYCGGPVGVVFITASARLVKVHGVLVLGLCTVAGLVIGSVVVDAVGPDPHLGPLTVLGAVLALTGVALGASATRRAERQRRATRASHMVGPRD